MVSKAPDGWAFSTGFVTEALMRERFFAAGPGAMGLMCGPPGLLKFVGGPGFTAMGYAPELQVEF